MAKVPNILGRMLEARHAFDPEDVSTVISDIENDRWVLLLDHIARFEVVNFTKQWIYRYSPPQMTAKGSKVTAWLVKWNSRFVHDIFLPDNLQRVWQEIRSPENPSILNFVLDLTVHLRRRVFGTQDEIDLLVEHVANSYCWIHESDYRLMDGIAQDLFVVDEQLFDELPTPESIRDLIRANSWLLPLLYLHDLRVEDLDELAALVVKQTKDAETRMQHPTNINPVQPTMVALNAVDVKKDESSS